MIFDPNDYAIIRLNWPELTERETMAVCYRLAGYTNKEIAHTNNLHPVTISKIFAHIRNKIEKEANN